EAPLLVAHDRLEGRVGKGAEPLLALVQPLHGPDALGDVADQGQHVPLAARPGLERAERQLDRERLAVLAARRELQRLPALDRRGAQARAATTGPGAPKWRDERLEREAGRLDGGVAEQR